MIVYVAATAGDADRVAQLFDEAGVAYSERLDAELTETDGRICYLGTVFEVDAGIAERCRQLLRGEGLTPI